MKLYLKILMLLFMPALAYAQQSQPDSLRHALKTAKTDSALLFAFRSLSGYYSERNRDSSIYYSDKAIIIAGRNSKVLDVAACLDGKGYQLLQQGKLPEAFQCLQQALKIAEDPQSEHKTFVVKGSRLILVADIHLNLGHLMGETNNTGQQLKEYKLTERISLQNDNQIELAVADMNLGAVYLRLNSLDSALIRLKNAERIFKKIGYRAYLGFVYQNIGTTYLQRNKDGLAMQYFHYGAKESLAQNNLQSAQDIYEVLLNYFIRGKQADSGLFYGRKSLAISRVIGSDREGGIYEGLFKCYQLKNEIDSAYKYQSLALTAKDNSFSATLKSLTDFQQLSLKDQQRLQELEKEKELIQARIRTYALLAVIAVFILLTVIFYRNNRQKQKANYFLKEQKEEIASQRDDLGRALEELKVTQTQLVQREKMASLGELTAGIAHEIQNPLNFVNNFSEVNKELLAELKQELAAQNYEEVGVIADDVIGNEEKINHHGKRADFIVKGMLEHSRTNTGEKQLADMNVLCDEFLNLSYHGLRAKDKSFNAEIVTHFDPKLPRINVSQQDMGRVMLNLFNNAFYAVNEKKKTAGDDYRPEVSISTFTEKNNLVIKVKDNGKGIPESIKEKIMQPFFTTKPTGEGTGLGLSLSYDIVVKGHGGNIQVTSVEGEGAEFVITLPTG